MINIIKVIGKLYVVLLLYIVLKITHALTHSINPNKTKTLLW